MNPQLAYEWVEESHAEGRESVVMLHGILGRRRNLFGFARLFIKKFPRFRVLLVDHRNHGESQGFEGPHTLLDCAEDLDVLLRHLKVTPRSIIGHSFGAGVAFAYAQHFEGAGSVWLLDAVPMVDGQQEMSPRSDLAQILASLPECARASSKAHFAECLRHKGIKEGLIAWLSMNVQEKPGGGVVFRPDVTSAKEMLSDFKKNYKLCDFKDLGQKVPVFLVKAQHNPDWAGAVQRPLEELATSGYVRDFVLPSAGHFVHTDNPRGILSMMEEDLG